MKKTSNFKITLINILWKLWVKPRKLAILFNLSERTIYRHLWRK